MDILEPVMQGLHMVSSTRCPAVLLFSGSGVRAGQRPKGQCPVEHRGEQLLPSVFLISRGLTDFGLLRIGLGQIWTIILGFGPRCRNLSLMLGFGL